MPILINYGEISKQVKSKNLDYIKDLVRDNPELLSGESVYRSSQITLLEECTTLNFVEAVEYLLEVSKDKPQFNKLINKSLFVSANGKYGFSQSIFDMLKDAGADVNATFESGFTPLMRACLSVNVEAVNALLKAGADTQLRATSGFYDFKTAMDILSLTISLPFDKVDAIKELFRQAEVDHFSTADINSEFAEGAAGAAAASDAGSVSSEENDWEVVTSAEPVGALLEENE